LTLALQKITLRIDSYTAENYSQQLEDLKFCMKSLYEQFGSSRDMVTSIRHALLRKPAVSRSMSPSYFVAVGAGEHSSNELGPLWVFFGRILAPCRIRVVSKVAPPIDIITN
jgi:hypothetical protein